MLSSLHPRLATAWRQRAARARPALFSDRRLPPCVPHPCYRRRYGDLRRVVTCDVNTPDYCGLTDADDASRKLFTRERRIMLRNIAMGRLLGTDTELEDYVKHYYKSPMTMLSDLEYHRRNQRLRLGVNTKEAWAMEMVGMAMTNTYHFGVHALRWYVAMHRQALLLAAHAAGARVAGETARARALFNAALHYEAHACHSLTDLFAPGHMTVDRWESSKQIYQDTLQRHRRKLRQVQATDLATSLPFPQWQDAMWMTSFPLHQQIMDTEHVYKIGDFDAPPPRDAGPRLTTAGLPPLRAVPRPLTNEIFEEGSMPHRLSTVSAAARAKEEKMA